MRKRGRVVVRRRRTSRETAGMRVRRLGDERWANLPLWGGGLWFQGVRQMRKAWCEEGERSFWDNSVDGCWRC